MKVFFDTSVLVGASENSHPHYVRAWPALRRVATGKDRGFMSVHSIAEVYAALTRLPVQPRIHPAEAERIVADNILPHFESPSVKGTTSGPSGWLGKGGGLERKSTMRCLLAARPGAELSGFTRSTSQISGSWRQISKR